MAAPHHGTALVALRSGAPILPCGITGTEAIDGPRVLIERPVITLTIGEPIPVEKVRRPTEAQIQALSQRIFESITALIPARYGGSYTGSTGSNA
jgi:1-acyl-sn-glycerol-3-phosphate acyltransferase